MNPVEAFIWEREGVQRELLQYFHLLFLNQPGVTCKIRYRIPFYYRNSWVVYLNPIKGDGVDVCFIRANELSNDQNLLEFKGRKQVGSLSYFSLEDIPETAVVQLLQEALLLDQEVPYKSYRNK